MASVQPLRVAPEASPWAKPARHAVVFAVASTAGMLVSMLTSLSVQFGSNVATGDMTQLFMVSRVVGWLGMLGTVVATLGLTRAPYGPLAERRERLRMFVWLFAGTTPLFVVLDALGGGGSAGYSLAHLLAAIAGTVFQLAMLENALQTMDLLGTKPNGWAMIARGALWVTFGFDILWMLAMLTETYAIFQLGPVFSLASAVLIFALVRVYMQLSHVLREAPTEPPEASTQVSAV